MNSGAIHLKKDFYHSTYSDFPNCTRILGSLPRTALFKTKPLLPLLILQQINYQTVFERATQVEVNRAFLFRVENENINNFNDAVGKFNQQTFSSFMKNFKLT